MSTAAVVCPQSLDGTAMNIYKLNGTTGAEREQREWPRWLVTGALQNRR